MQNACPTPAEGDGQLVTTKFIHENAEVDDLIVGRTVGIPRRAMAWEATEDGTSHRRVTPAGHSTDVGRAERSEPRQ